MQLDSAPPELFFSKHDSQDIRLGDLAKSTSLQNLTAPTVVIWGAADDEGIKLNGGRPGAALAPHEIRRVFYKMTPPAGPFPQTFADLGQVPLSLTLPERHERIRAVSLEAHRQGHFTLSLGGGHDYGFPDAAGFVEASLAKQSGAHLTKEPVRETQKPLVINFDAHLDVRPADQGFHSGTPFRRLLEAFPQQFEFWELGLQPQCNSLAHVAWAEVQGAQLVFLENMMKTEPADLEIEPNSKRPCFLSVDLDVFSSKEAPGCSQSWATGLTIETFLPWLEYFMTSFNVRGLGFYEVSPPLDTDNRTSKLTALLMFHALRLHARKQAP